MAAVLVGHSPVLVADECWIALALLHREHPAAASFTAREIQHRLKTEGVHTEVRAGVAAYICQHNVANIAPSSARLRLFYREADGELRLFRPGDDFHPARVGKTHPERENLPPKYRGLLDWYEKRYCARSWNSRHETDPVLAMRGAGREVWIGIDADAYVESLRAGWEPLPHAGRRRRAR